MIRLAVAALAAALLASPAGAQTLEGPMTAVSGETLLNIDGSTIRLFGIDAPELTTIEGWGAKMALDSVVNGQQVSCDPVGTDAFQRVSAVCGTGATSDLGLFMLGNGWATAVRTALRGFTREGAYLDAERQARQACAGFFAGKPWC